MDAYDSNTRTGPSRKPLGAGCARAYLLFVLLCTWLVLVLPGLGFGASIASIFELVVAEIFLSSFGETPAASIGVSMLVSLTIVGVAMVLQASLWLGRLLGGSPRRRRRSWMGRLSAPAWVLAISLLVLVFNAPMEWCANNFFPDLFVFVPVLNILLLVVFWVPVRLLIYSGRATRWLFGAVKGRPFLGGMVAGTCTLLLAPTAAFLLTVGSVGAVLPLMVLPQLEQDAPYQQHSNLEDALELLVAEALRAAGEEALSAQTRNAEAEFQACMNSLYGTSRGIHAGGYASEVDKAQVSLRYRFSLTEQEAEDAVHTALIKICTSSSLQSYRNLGAVFMEACKNEAVNIHRRRLGLGRDPPPQICPVVRTDEVRLNTEVRLVQEALTRLDPTTQQALSLWAQGFTHREIGRHLGLTESQSRNRVANALKKMRREVTKRCAF